MVWEFAKAEQIGGRDEQQDRVDFFSARGGGNFLAVLADGMGGHKGGAVAAQTIVDTARELWQKQKMPLAEPQSFLLNVCNLAHERVNAAGEKLGLKPRSTAVLLYARDGEAHWLSIGDSRLYRFRGGKLLERTRDHSVVQMLFDMGKITEEEMADHPDQNRILQCVGGDSTPEPQLGQAKVEAGDGFLLCSDGLWETVKIAEMASGLTQSSLAAAADDLARQAAKRGGRKGDNVTVALGRQTGRRGVSRLALVGLLVLAAAAAAALTSRVLLQRPDRVGPAGVQVPVQPEKPAGLEAPKSSGSGTGNKPE